MIVDLQSPDPDRRISEGTIRLEQRLHGLVALAPAIGLELEVLSSDALGTPTARGALQRAAGVWWTGGMAFARTIEPMWARLQADLGPRAGGVPVLEAPDVVEEASNLGIYYSLLQAGGVWQAPTTLLPLDARQSALAEVDLREHLTARVADVAIPAEGLFFRTFYGTRKQLFSLNVATERAELAEGLTDLVVALRDVQRQEIGGLALRELIPIATVRDPSGREVQRELRVFVVGGEPVYWNLHGDLPRLTKLVDRRTLAAAGSPTPSQLADMTDIVRRTAACLRSQFFTVDFALRPDGTPALIEVNHAYCAGWGLDIAYVAVFGQLLRWIARLPLLDTATIERLGAAADLTRWGRDEVWGLLHA